ncbi:MAG: lipoprotein [Gammaproteobacteria bacterium]|nr:lipoprotein [Gammaproteobacteria bacterium]
MILRNVLGLLLLTGAIAACGQKGPLFLPDEGPAETPPVEDVAGEAVSGSG